MADQQVAPPEEDESLARSRPRRGLGVLGRLLIVVVVVAVGSTAAWLLTSTGASEPHTKASDIPALQVTAADVQPGSVVPDVATVAATKAAPRAKAKVRPRAKAKVRPHSQADASTPGSLQTWAKLVAPATGIPPRALLAYGRAELIMRQIQPGCHLSWATLAGIGRVESNHGRYGGAHLLPNGDESQPVVGVPLDGTSGNRRIRSGGAYARAAGPMQFIPSTWRRWATDGNGDHRGDPENIDDATATAGRYLCAGGRDMNSAAGWWSGLFSYNHSAVYGQKVFGLADRYAHQEQRAMAGH